MRGDPNTAQHVAAPSFSSRSLPAAVAAAGACGITPQAHGDPKLGVIYSGESDVSDSGKALEASRSPVVPRPSRDLTNERTRDMRHSLFGSDDEFGNGILLITTVNTCVFA